MDGVFDTDMGLRRLEAFDIMSLSQSTSMVDYLSDDKELVQNQLMIGMMVMKQLRMITLMLHMRMTKRTLVMVYF